MAAPQFAIGIDLGTTNCALAYRPLTGACVSSVVLAIPQCAQAGQVTTRSTLPSFLYRPLDSEAERFREGPGMEGGWITGLAARAQAMRSPGRVAHSAKSWLAHHAADPEAKMLPWGVDTLSEAERISPLEASARLLRQLALAWAEAFPHSPLADQTVTVTVPASFDAGAQAATLEAARRAGLPAATRLLEEPQAAFYRWLEATPKSAQALAPGQSVLIVDVGGGTSDFSLFRVTEAKTDQAPSGIERIAVSEHILLGGDNIDLALAHYLEAQLAPEGGEIKGEAWSHLVARARELKERALDGSAEETLRVAAPGQGSSLFATSRSAEFAARELREIVREGFFPLCARHERPSTERSALQEWGLPYASDFAVTRYLAEFLRDQPGIDAVLFNGGSLAAPLLRERLVEQLVAWNDGNAPRVLENAETDLAVARGAAFFGGLRAGDGRRIAAGAARSVYLEVGGAGSARQLVCVLPRGTPAEQPQKMVVVGLRARVNELARFRAYQGAHGRVDAAGVLVTWNEKDFTELPALETRLELEGGGEAAVSVELGAQLNELGLLEIALLEATSSDDGAVWPLRFNLRPAEGDTLASGPEILVLPEASVEAAVARLDQAFASASGKGERLTAARVFKRLESVLGHGRFDWPLEPVRRWADALLAHPEWRERSADHFEAWLYLVSWCLRPGFGDGADAGRIDRLWSLAGPETFPFKKRTEPLFGLLWRRVAGGLSGERQTALWEHLGDGWLQSGATHAESIRLAGALERLEVSTKERLAEALLAEAVERIREERHPAPCLAALAGLLARVPLVEGAMPVPPVHVEAAWQALRGFDWSQPHLAEVLPFFLRAARRVEDEAANLPSKLSRKIAEKLEKSGVGPGRLEPLQAFVPVQSSDRQALYEETLPPGLIL